MGARIPRFKAGKHLRAAELNAIVERVNATGTVTGDGLINVHDGPHGLSFSLNVEALQARLAGPPTFIALVESSTKVAGLTHDTQWTYSCKRAYKSDAGYGASCWTTYGDAFTAYNAAENINTGADSHREGNGIDTDSLDIDVDATDDFDFFPIQDDTPVLVQEVQLDDNEGGDIEYWIMGAGYPNGVDGTCP